MRSVAAESTQSDRQSAPACECCRSLAVTKVANTRGGDYHRCLQCGHETQSSLFPVGEQFESAQLEHFGESSICLSTAMNVLERERIAERRRIVDKYLARGSILEVGPGSGNTAAAFIDSGYAISAVEHSPALGDAIRTRLDIDTWIGEFEQIDFRDQTYDAYASFHVLEHVVDMSAHLEKAASVVRPEGYAFIATPNAGSTEHRLLGCHSPNYSSAHLRLFTADSLEKSLRDCGWLPVELVTPSYTDAHVRVLTACLRAVRKRLHGDGRHKPQASYAAAAAGRWGQLTLGTARVLTWPIRRIQSKLKKGNELMIVARRA